MPNQDRHEHGGYGQGGFGRGEYGGGYGAGRRGGQGEAGHERGTGTADPTYDLVSVLYHALQGAQTYFQYERDAQRSGDQELAEFFHQVHRDESRRADHAKRLLADRLRRS
jgi:hypothetical protein